MNNGSPPVVQHVKRKRWYVVGRDKNVGRLRIYRRAYNCTAANKIVIDVTFVWVDNQQVFLKMGMFVPSASIIRSITVLEFELFTACSFLWPFKAFIKYSYGFMLLYKSNIVVRVVLQEVYSSLSFSNKAFYGEAQGLPCFFVNLYVFCANTIIYVFLGLAQPQRK